MVGRPRRRFTATSQQARHQHHESHSPAVIDERRQRRHDQHKRPVRLFFFVVFLAVLGFVGWMIVKSAITYGKVVDSNSTKRAPVLKFLDDIKPNQLQGEGDGRVNVLLIGVGGTRHPGGTLADTIIVASLDTKNKEVALLSIPRDLYVPIDGNGSGKINSAHSYGEKNAKTSGGGPAVLKKTVSTILDLPIHYYVRVDFDGLEDLVDALGGVTVNVERPIVDLSYPADNMVDYQPFRLKAGTQTLDGKTALKYVRSRHASGGEGSDFARARRQQLLLSAIREKALSAGVLTNPKKISDIMGVLGNHIKTDISLWEAERFMQTWKDVDTSKILHKVLDNGANGPLVSHSGDARGYILLPRAGDFSEVAQIAHEIFTDPFLREEEATIALINASGSTTIGKGVVSQLKSYGYQVTDVTPKAQEKLTATVLVDHTKSKPYTKKFLESRFNLTAISSKQGKQESPSPYDMTLTIGTNYTPKKVQTTTKIASPSPKALKSGE